METHSFYTYGRIQAEDHHTSVPIVVATGILKIDEVLLLPVYLFETENF
jgi:hypothetical protein